MDNERVLHILDRLSGNVAPGVSIGASLCATATDVLDISGAGLMVMTDDAQHQSTGASSALMAVIEELQHTYGEGPCIDAHQRGLPVLEPDLAGFPASRWLGFTPPAVAAGARAVFGFPLQLGGARIGALNLCAEQAGGFSERQHGDALVLADVATHALLAAQADAPAHTLAAELADVGTHQVVVHQATGMVAVQLGASVADALVRLRAHAFATDQPISAVAAEVVGRRLRFDP